MDLMPPEEREELRALRRLKEIERRAGLVAYRPHEKQEMFHRAGGFKFRFVRTGNRFGKSVCGAAEDLAFALGARVWLDKSDPAYTLGIPKHATKGLIIVADWDKAREIFTNQEKGERCGKLMALLPEAHFEGVHKNQSGEIDCVMVKCLHGGTSLIYLDTVKSFKSNAMGQESSDWDWIHVDEPIPKAQWTANRRGLMDRKGKAWFTCTPIAEQWINDMFIPQSRLKDDFHAGYVRKDAPDRWILTGSSFENPYVDREEVESFSEDLSPEERAARIYGRPQAYAGVVYSEFKSEEHKLTELPVGWKDWDCPPDNYTIRVSIDPHPKTPHAVLFAATAPTGQTIIYREYFCHVMIEELADAILDILAGREAQVVICDPSAFVADPISGAMWVDTLWKKGIPAQKSVKDLQHGIPKTKQALASKIDGKPMLRFAPSLQRTFYEFDVYVWDSTKDNKPVDKNDHMMECLYRLAMNGLDYIDPSEDKEYDPGQMPLDGDLSVPGYNTAREWSRNLNAA